MLYHVKSSSVRFYIFVVIGFVYLAGKYFVIVFHNFFLYIVNISSSVHTASKIFNKLFNFQRYIYF